MTSKNTKSFTTKAKPSRKKMLKTGAVRKAAHLGSVTKRRQAVRDSKNLEVDVDLSPSKRVGQKNKTGKSAKTTAKTLANPKAKTQSGAGLKKAQEKVSSKSSGKDKSKVTPATTKSIKYVDVDQSAALDAYVRERCSSLLRRVSARPNRYSLKFRIRPESRKKNSKISSFSVKGELTITGQSKLQAKAKDKNVKSAIDSVIKKLETKIQRETEKRESSRRTVGKSSKHVKEFTWELNMESR